MSRPAIEASPALAARNDRIRELRAQSWSLPAIGREVGLSHARVSQILTEAPRPEDILRAEEHAVALELRLLEPALADLLGRVRQLRTRRRIIEEELAEIDIKRLLGL